MHENNRITKRRMALALGEVKLGTLIQELGASVPELRKVTSRSKAMAACYPGQGARYVKHVDNDGKHPLCRTRLLTALPLGLEAENHGFKANLKEIRGFGNFRGVHRGSGSI